MADWRLSRSGRQWLEVKEEVRLLQIFDDMQPNLCKRSTHHRWSGLMVHMRSVLG